MNTGAQQSYSTPLGHRTSTSHVGPGEHGKSFHHRDTPQIMAATNIPYVFTGVEGFPDDLLAKGAKAQWYARNEGMAYGKILISCPLNWLTEDRAGTDVVRTAVDSCFFPLYEIERHRTSLTYDPEPLGRRDPGRRLARGRWARRGTSRKPGFEDDLARIEAEVDRRWRRLKAMSEHPEL